MSKIFSESNEWAIVKYLELADDCGIKNDIVLWLYEKGYIKPHPEGNEVLVITRKGDDLLEDLKDNFGDPSRITDSENEVAEDWCWEYTINDLAKRLDWIIGVVDGLRTQVKELEEWRDEK